MLARQLAVIATLVFYLIPVKVSAQTEHEKIDQAKKEKVVNRYGSMDIGDAQALVEATRKKYPFLQINRTRGNNPATLNLWGQYGF